jgi:hypothetical protein
MLIAFTFCCLSHPTPLTALLTSRLAAVQGYLFYFGLLLSALNRLPLKLPQRGAGRRHIGSGAQPQQVVKFDDVAGVDEAKEELAEVVVRALCAFLMATFEF